MEWPIAIAWSVEPWKDSVSRRVMLRRSFAAQKTTVFCKNPHTDGYGLEDYCFARQTLAIFIFVFPCTLLVRKTQRERRRKNTHKQSIMNTLAQPLRHTSQMNSNYLILQTDFNFQTIRSRKSFYSIDGPFRRSHSVSSRRGSKVASSSHLWQTV